MQVQQKPGIQANVELVMCTWAKICCNPTKSCRGKCGTCYVYLGKSLLHSYKIAVVTSFYIFWLTSRFLERAQTYMSDMENVIWET